MNYKTLKSNYCFIFCDKSNLYSPTRSVPALQPGAGRSVSRLWSKLPNAGCLCNCHWMLFKIQSQPKPKTLPKAQRTRGLSSYHKFKHESWSNFILRISTSKSQPNIGLSIKLVQTYVASEYQPRFNFMTSTKHQQKKLQLQILPELQLQNLDQT